VFRNLETALLAAATPNFGVWVAFNESVIRAVRSTKIDISVSCSDAFVSNVRDEIHISDFQCNDYAVNRGQKEMFNAEVSEAVEIFCLTHTTDAVCLKSYLDNSNLKALIVLIYGMSGHRIELMEILSRWAADNGTIVIAKSHSPFGSTDLSKYELGVKALKMGIVSSLDMTLESTYAKTCHLLAQGVEPQEFCSWFYLNYCGELDEAGVEKFRKQVNYWLSTS
jgi:L-asparaginase/Glu-tRNA(Gln) amidotransferase subunit D